MIAAGGQEALPTVYLETTIVSYLTARPSRDLVVAAQLPGEPGVEELVKRYYEAISLPGRARADSPHLALAAWHGVDFLVSRNGTHIASGRVRRVLESVNRELRIRMLEICTPYELMEDEDDS